MRMPESFRVFGCDFSKLIDEFNIKYSVSAYFALIFLSVVTLYMGFVSLPIGFIESFYKMPDSGLAISDPSLVRNITALSIGIIGISIPLSVIAVFGFVCLAHRWKNMLLAEVSITFLLLGVIYSIIQLASGIMFIETLKSNDSIDMAKVFFPVVFGGLSGIAFGVAFLKLRKGGLVQAAGVGNILVGLLYASMVLLVFGIFANIFLMCLEAYILHRESKVKN
jgi:hypothetical protein